MSIVSLATTGVATIMRKIDLYCMCTPFKVYTCAHTQGYMYTSTHVSKPARVS